MLDLRSYIYESLDIDEARAKKAATNNAADVKETNKWLKQQHAKGLKVVNGIVNVMGKSGAKENILELDASVDRLPDFIQFQKEPYQALLDITAPGLTTMQGFPMPDVAAHLKLHNCNSLKDFDGDFSKNKSGCGSLEFWHCHNLESFSGLKTLKSGHGLALGFHDCPNVTSLEFLKQFKGVTIYPSQGLGIKDLTGYPEKWDHQLNSFDDCPNLESLNGYVAKEGPSSIYFKDCPKLSKVGNCKWPKDSITESYIFYNCPSVDEKFLEELWDLSSHKQEAFFGAPVTVRLYNTKVKENSSIIKRIKKEIPKAEIEINDKQI